MTDMVPYFVMGMGVTFVLLIGSIDLSIGSMASAATCVMAVYLPKIGAWAFVITILMGIAGGFINGYLVAKLKLPSFIATLGMMSVWQSIAYLVSGSQAVQIMKDQWGYIAWAKTYVGIIPVGFIASLVLWAILAKIHTSTAFGKGCVAVGVNERAAQIAGVNATKIKITAFVICECMAALSGIVVAAKLKGGLPTAGDAMTMLAIAAVQLERRKGRLAFNAAGNYDGGHDPERFEYGGHHLVLSGYCFWHFDHYRGVLCGRQK